MSKWRITEMTNRGLAFRSRCPLSHDLKALHHRSDRGSAPQVEGGGQDGKRFSRPMMHSRLAGNESIICRDVGSRWMRADHVPSVAGHNMLAQAFAVITSPSKGCA